MQPEHWGTALPTAGELFENLRFSIARLIAIVNGLCSTHYK
jgi:hypothetical protein